MLSLHYNRTLSVVLKYQYKEAHLPLLIDRKQCVVVVEYLGHDF